MGHRGLFLTTDYNVWFLNVCAIVEMFTCHVIILLAFQLTAVSVYDVFVQSARVKLMSGSFAGMCGDYNFPLYKQYKNNNNNNV